MLSALVLAGCPAPSGDTGYSVWTSTPLLPWSASPGSIAVLTEPGGGLLHSHATVSWGADDRYAVAFAAGAEPAAQALVQVFDAEGMALADPNRLNAAGGTGDKPDIAWDGRRYVAAWTDIEGRVSIGAITEDGAIETRGSVLYDGIARTDAVDLALQPGGDGIAIWTEFGAPGADPDAGRIVWRAFDAALAGAGPPRLTDASSRKTSDAAPTPDGGWTAVWAIDYDHPVEPDVIYEVWGRQHRPDGTAWTFRADDLDTAYPSRPAVAVRRDGSGMFAVTWRDKSEADGAGLGSGAYVRLFDADALPVGPSLALDPGGDGDRVVVDWAGELAVVVWQQTDELGAPGVVLSAVDATSGAPAVDRLWVSEPGDERDERPSVAIRDADGGYDVLVVWEALGPQGSSLGLRARRIWLGRG